MTTTAVPYDHLLSNGAAETDPMDTWDDECGTGPEDPVFGINWRHLTMIAPEYGTNTNHTGYIWTIDTTDPAKPFLLSKWKLPGTSILSDGTEHEHHYIPGGYIYSPHNGDTGTNGHVYWTHYHAGNWSPTTATSGATPYGWTASQPPKSASPPSRNC